MKRELQKKLDSMLKTDLMAAENLDFTDEGKKTGIAVVRAGVALEMEVDKGKRDDKRLELEQEKWKYEKQKFDDDKKIKDDLAFLDRQIKQKEIELKNKEIEAKNKEMSLEEQRLANDKASKEALLVETKSKYKKEIIIAAIGGGATLLTTIASKIVYMVLTLNAQKHDYEDFKLESSYSKEGRKNIDN